MSSSTKAASSKVSVATPVVLYGISSDDKPQAALFPLRLGDLAIKAAAQLKLNVLKVTSEEIVKIATKLPTGRINSSGRGLVGNVRRPLYDELVAVAGNTATALSNSALAETVTQTVPLNESRTKGNSVGTEGLPKSWKDIGSGSLVLVQESLHDGWWEAIVVERKDDMLTLRWRDYPKWKPFTIHADAVALLNATPTFKAA